MEERKNLYVIGYTHSNPFYADNKDIKPSKKIKYSIRTIKDLIKLLGENKKILRFFSDGYNYDSAQNMRYNVNFLKNCDEKISKEYLKNRMIEFPQQEEDLKIAQSLAYLKKKGINIKICTTEIFCYIQPLTLLLKVFKEGLESEEFIKKLFKKNNKYQKCYKELFDENWVNNLIKTRRILKEEKISELEFVYKTFNNEQIGWYTDMRDNYIYQNFLKYSHNENLLAIGGKHKLKLFKKDKKIKIYRTDIEIDGTDSNPHKIRYKGELPEDLEKIINSFLKKQAIENKIKYK